MGILAARDNVFYEYGASHHHQRQPISCYVLPATTSLHFTSSTIKLLDEEDCVFIQDESSARTTCRAPNIIANKGQASSNTSTETTQGRLLRYRLRALSQFQLSQDLLNNWIMISSVITLMAVYVVIEVIVNVLIV